MSGKGTPLVSVLGAGSWGTSIAHIIGANGHPVYLWCRRKGAAAEINKKHRNSRYLGDAQLSDNIVATTSLAKAVKGVPLVFLVVPSKSFRTVCREAGEMLTPEQFVVHATKGFEAGTHFRMSEVIMQETCVRQLGVLSGPNIAPEIMAGKPAGTVVASRFPKVTEAAQRALVTNSFRVYSGDDVIGVELAGALKNIVAIAAGIATRLELGENTKALLITRGMSEIARLGTRLGAPAPTFSGLAGFGDLLVTCASPLSRNHRVGAALAEGKKLPEIVASLGMVAEGVNTAVVAHEIIARMGLYAPLLDGVYRVVHQGLHPRDALNQLMALESRPDVDLGQ